MPPASDPQPHGLHCGHEAGSLRASFGGQLRACLSWQWLAPPPAGIDAPESKQAFGSRSKQRLAGMVFGKDVLVEWNKLDRYGQTIGVVLVDGHDTTLEQIRAGMAWWYRRYANEQTPDDRQHYDRQRTRRANHGAGYGRILSRPCRGSFAGKAAMNDSWSRDKLVAVALLIAAMTPDSKAAMNCR